MALHRMSSEPRATVWMASLSRLLTATAVGALLGMAYGVLVGGAHFVAVGRLDWAPSFAVGAICVGAGLGLAIGLVLAVSVYLKGSSAAQPFSPTLSATTTARTPWRNKGVTTGSPPCSSAPQWLIAPLKVRRATLG